MFLATPKYIHMCYIVYCNRTRKPMVSGPPNAQTRNILHWTRESKIIRSSSLCSSLLQSYHSLARRCVSKIFPNKNRAPTPSLGILAHLVKWWLGCTITSSERYLGFITILSFGEPGSLGLGLNGWLSFPTQEIQWFTPYTTPKHLGLGIPNVQLKTPVPSRRPPLKLHSWFMTWRNRLGYLWTIGWVVSPSQDAIVTTRIMNHF